MRIRRMLVATAALAAASAALAGPASAATSGQAAKSATHTPKTFARLAGPVVADPHNPEVGYVAAVYRCSGEGHLWLSVKQVQDRSRDPRLQEEGSSQIAAAWSDSHRNSVNCDGRTHLQVFTVDQEEGAQGPESPPKSESYGPLKRGWGWVQFCLFDDNYPIPGPPYSENKFERVLALR